ncbi:MAG: hypothetical protein ABL921_14070 [Pirellula sp.]
MSESSNSHELRLWMPTLQAYCSAIARGEPIEAPDIASPLGSNAPEIRDLVANIEVDDSTDALSSDCVSPNLDIVRLGDADLRADLCADLGGEPSRLEVIQFPIEKLVPKIIKSSTFVLGLGTLGTCNYVSHERLIVQLVKECVRSTNRRVMLIQFAADSAAPRPECDDLPAESPTIDGIDRTVWYLPGESKSDKLRWNRQLAQMVELHEEYGLIVLELGDLGMGVLPRSSRLCDGIVIQMLESLTERETIRALKTIRVENLPVLGAWSLTLGSKAVAA